MNVAAVVGARPNFVKIAPILAEMSRYPALRDRLVHTGQHYDLQMSRVFFDAAWQQIRRGDWPMGRLPELWDGKASERIAAVIRDWQRRS